MVGLAGRIDESWASGQIDEEAVALAIDALDRGAARVAERTPGAEGPDAWVVNEWLKRAILLYFRMMPMRHGSWGDYHWSDKIPLKTDLTGIRVVPPGSARRPMVEP